jgi:hypothetical protein
MKTWKNEIANDICKAAADARIVSLKEVAAARGIDHIKTQEAREIMGTVLKALPDYHAVQLTRTEHDSLFQSLCFVENGVEFDGGAAYAAEG